MLSQIKLYTTQNCNDYINLFGTKMWQFAQRMMQCGDNLFRHLASDMFDQIFGKLMEEHVLSEAVSDLNAKFIFANAALIKFSIWWNLFGICVKWLWWNVAKHFCIRNFSSVNDNKPPVLKDAETVPISTFRISQIWILLGYLNSQTLKRLKWILCKFFLWPFQDAAKKWYQSIFYKIHFLTLHPRIATSSKASQQAAPPLPMICDALLQWLKGCDSKYTNIKVECFPLNHVSGANWIHVSCILQQHSFGKLDFLHWNQLPPLWRLQNSKPRVGQWPHCSIPEKFCCNRLPSRALCITVLLPKTFPHLVILSNVFSLWRSHYPLSATVSGPFVSRLPKSGPSLRENVRCSWRKFVWTETSRLNKGVTETDTYPKLNLIRVPPLKVDWIDNLWHILSNFHC